MDPKTNNNKVRILKTEGSDNDWTSTGEITSEVWDAMMTLDDFLLTLCPDPETGQFEQLVGPGRGGLGSGRTGRDAQRGVLRRALQEHRRPVGHDPADDPSARGEVMYSKLRVVNARTGAQGDSDLDEEVKLLHGNVYCWTDGLRREFERKYGGEAGQKLGLLFPDELSR
jgi:hypothetical protein